jgi:hypothetical protein
MRIIIEWNRCREFHSKQLALQFPTMPRIFFRLLAVLFLALTIPVQGMAAVMTAQCMAAGHHQDGARQGDHTHEQGGADGHDQHSHSDAGDATQDNGGNPSHCGPCTACCASASIAGPAGLLILALPSTVAYVFSPLPPPGVQPDGFDRPPLAL